MSDFYDEADGPVMMDPAEAEQRQAGFAAAIADMPNRIPPYRESAGIWPAFGPVFTAEYRTECESCEDPIEPGEDARADGCGGWIHADTMCEKVAKQ
jgi:hypothetical protein